MLINSDMEFNLLSLLLNTEDRKLRLKIINEIKPEIFGDVSSRNLFSAIKYLMDNNLSIDASTISDAFKKLKLEVDDSNILVLSVQNRGITEDTANYKDYLDVIEDLYLRRNLTGKIDKAKKKVEDTSIKIFNILADLRELSLIETKEDYIISPGMYEKIRREEMQKRAQLDKMIVTGFDNIDDDLVKGFAPGEISVIAGRTGMGKSLFKTNLIKNMGGMKVGVASFCLEQDIHDELDRLTAAMKGIPIKEQVQVYKWPSDDSRIEDVINVPKTMDKKKEWNVHMINKRSMTMVEAINITALLKQSFDIDVVFFDLFDRFLDISSPVNKAERIAEMLPRLLEWARILQVHFCLVVQIGQHVDKRKDKKPTISDLRSSSAYADTANIVFLIYRESFYKEYDVEKAFEVRIAKQKQGSVNTAYFDVDLKRMLLTPRIGF